MTEENSVVVERAIEAFSERDVDLLTELATEDFELFPAIGWVVDVAGYKGLAGIEAFFEEVDNTWEEFRVIAEETRYVGDRVLLLCRIELRGRVTGVEVELPGGIVFDFRAGKLSSARRYLGREEALKAVGLSE